MYEIIQSDNSFGVVGIDGEIISTRQTKIEAEHIAQENRTEYLSVISETLSDIIDESRSNVVVMDANAHDAIHLANLGRKRSWNHKLGCFTELNLCPKHAKHEISHQEFRAQINWVPASEKKLPPRKSRESAWSQKLAAATK